MVTSKSPSPVLRGLASLLAFYGAFATHSLLLLGIALGVAVLVLAFQTKLPTFGRFAFGVILPVGLGLVLIWGFVRQGTPEPNTNHSIQSGVVYATTITLRLALLGALFQATFLSLPIPKLVHLLQSFGVRGRALAIIVSTLNLWPDFRRQVEQVIAARCARGLMRDRRPVTRLRQAPLAIRTLFISGLGHGLDRAEAWEAGGLIAKLGRIGNQADTANDYSKPLGVACIILAATWATVATLCFK